MMKTTGLFILALFALVSCAPRTTTSGSTGSSTAQSISPEAEAKAKTNKMKTVLGLSSEQESKVMLINTVNIKLVRSLRDSNQRDKLAATHENYLKELQGVLTPEQFARYKQEFEGK